MKDKTSNKYFSLDEMNSRAKDKPEENYNYKLELWFSVKKDLLFKNISLDDIEMIIERDYQDMKTRLLEVYRDVKDGELSEVLANEDIVSLGAKCIDFTGS